MPALHPSDRRFVIERHPAERALPGMPSTARPAWWEVIDRYSYPSEDTDTLGFYREGFATKGEALACIDYRRRLGEPTGVSVLTLD
jgi:hypothetical protein